MEYNRYTHFLSSHLSRFQEAQKHHEILSQELLLAFQNETQKFTEALRKIYETSVGDESELHPEDAASVRNQILEDLECLDE